MKDQPNHLPESHPHLRTVAMPRDANPSCDIFGGWTVSQMDLDHGKPRALRDGSAQGAAESTQPPSAES